MTLLIEMWLFCVAHLMKLLFFFSCVLAWLGHSEQLKNQAHSLSSLFCSFASQLFVKHFVCKFIFNAELKAEENHKRTAIRSELGQELCPGKDFQY